MDAHASKKIQKRRRDDEDDDKSGPVDDDVARLKNKAVEKANKRFSVSLIMQAISCDWEDHDLARLVLLICKERELTDQKTLSLLQSCGICTPVVLTTLTDEGFNFSATEMIGAMYDQAQHVDRFIEVIGDSFEQNLLHLGDEATLDAVRIFILQHSILLSIII